jgi:lipopolysaccharide assembly outer membrane protein LptD (OstA)
MDFLRNLWPHSWHVFACMVLRMLKFRPLLILLPVLLGLSLHTASAQPIEGLEIASDELFEDKREARIIARGNVEIRYFGEILLADRVISTGCGPRATSGCRKPTAGSPGQTL